MTSCSVTGSRPATAAAASEMKVVEVNRPFSPLVRQSRQALQQSKSGRPSTAPVTHWGWAESSADLTQHRQNAGRSRPPSTSGNAGSSRPATTSGIGSVAARIYARASHPRLGATTAASTPEILRRAQPLAHTPYSDYIRSVAQSSFQTGGVFLPSSVRAQALTGEEIALPLQIVVKQVTKGGLSTSIHQRRVCASLWFESHVSFACNPSIQSPGDEGGRSGEIADTRC